MWAENGFGGFILGASSRVVMVQTRCKCLKIVFALLGFFIFLKRLCLIWGLIEVLYGGDAVSSLCSVRTFPLHSGGRYRCYAM